MRRKLEPPVGVRVNVTHPRLSDEMLSRVADSPAGRRAAKELAARPWKRGFADK